MQSCPELGQGEGDHFDGAEFRTRRLMRVRPSSSSEIRNLIHTMSIANPLWGAPRIHGELLKLGIDVGQTTVATYMTKTRRPPSQGWKTFLVNHADGIASMDLFVVPTISFRLLYGFLILLNARRELLWLGVTVHPTAEWIAQQFTEAFVWRNAPRYARHLFAVGAADVVMLDVDMPELDGISALPPNPT
jgi:hypothetical protein